MFLVLFLLLYHKGMNKSIKTLVFSINQRKTVKSAGNFADLTKPRKGEI